MRATGHEVAAVTIRAEHTPCNGLWSGSGSLSATQACGNDGDCIEKSSPRGSCASGVERTGGATGKNSANNALSTAKASASATNHVTFTTRSRLLPARHAWAVDDFAGECHVAQVQEGAETFGVEAYFAAGG